jgi:hypothetical protein
MDLTTWPTWLLWGWALLGAATLTAVLFWIMPPRLRRAEGGRSVALGIGLFVVFTALAGSPRSVLWFAGGGFLVAAVPLLWMGRLPADMPSAKDPAARSHPSYDAVARRGRIAGIAILLLEVLWITFAVSVSG